MAANPWDRLKTESEAAYAAFLTYRDIGISRTLIVATNLLVKQRKGKNRAITGTIGRWSTDNGWVERCRAWDDHLQAERDRVAVAEARKWEGRRQQALNANWDTAQKLRDRLEKMLAFPVSRQRTEQDNGRTIIIIEPAKWSFQTAALLAKTAAELEAATLMAVGEDPDTLTDAEARGAVHEPPAGAAEEA